MLMTSTAVINVLSLVIISCLSRRQLRSPRITVDQDHDHDEDGFCFDHVWPPRCRLRRDLAYGAAQVPVGGSPDDPDSVAAKRHNNPYDDLMDGRYYSLKQSKALPFGDCLT